MDIPYRNRSEAGKHLAGRLLRYRDRPDTIVLGLPRGGVPVAFEVALQLNLPLDVFVVRKLGVPQYEELAMGAIASGGVRVVNREIVNALRIDDAAIERATERERVELARRERSYRGSLPTPDLRGRTVILTDDGLATGSTMKAAVMALRLQHPARIVVAVPVAAPETCAEFEAGVDEIVCVHTPALFRAVGSWYDDFSETTDEEIRALLAQARNREPAGAKSGVGRQAPRGDHL